MVPGRGLRPEEVARGQSALGASGTSAECVARRWLCPINEAASHRGQCLQYISRTRKFFDFGQRLRGILQAMPPDGKVTHGLGLLGELWIDRLAKRKPRSSFRYADRTRRAPSRKVPKRITRRATPALAVVHAGLGVVAAIELGSLAAVYMHLACGGGPPPPTRDAPSPSGHRPAAPLPPGTAAPSLWPSLSWPSEAARGRI